MLHSLQVFLMQAIVFLHEEEISETEDEDDGITGKSIVFSRLEIRGTSL